MRRPAVKEDDNACLPRYAEVGRITSSEISLVTRRGCTGTPTPCRSHMYLRSRAYLCSTGDRFSAWSAGDVGEHVRMGATAPFLCLARVRWIAFMSSKSSA